MRRTVVGSFGVVLVTILAACGGGDTGSGDGDQDSSNPGADNGGQVVDQQPAGQAIVTVDGRDYTLQESPVADCAITPETVTAAFWVGDNSVTLGAGTNLYEDGWLGAIILGVAEPEGEDGPIRYVVEGPDHGDRIVIDGDSMSYSGPMYKYPPNDGSNPPPTEVEGTISLTCG